MIELTCSCRDASASIPSPYLVVQHSGEILKNKSPIQYYGLALVSILLKLPLHQFVIDIVSATKLIFTIQQNNADSK